tara:strand:+ start:11663 stop:12616 length:954 start_codon:yes stop_codon:yes gene_type:complete
MNNFNWFTGVIEDIDDPRMINRVRVRCFGFHDESKTLIGTEDLPWATVMMPCTASGMSGLGASPHGLYAGSWVVGFFRDGASAQDPVIMGSMMGEQGDAPDKSKGFCDPTATYPKTEYLNRSDVNLLATGVNIISYPLDNTSAEPASPYAAVYPHNKVTETPTGHVIEIDDTVGAERIRIKHSSGTLVEMHPNGDIVQRNGNKWNITTGNDKTHITGLMEVHIDGDSVVNIGASSRLHVLQDADIVVGGSTTLTCSETTITGDLAIGGSIVVGSSIRAGTTIDAGGALNAATVDSALTSLDDHTHTGDSGGKTGPPS